MNAVHEIRGWCPGALRPMPSGDGLLLRAKTVGPRLTTQQAIAVAEISLSCGNGLLDLSQRAQLQLRGVRDETLAAAQRALFDAALLAADAEAERLLSIIAPPLAGLTADAAFDAQKVLEELAAQLLQDALLRALPAKFCFLVDDGAAPGLAASHADVRIEAMQRDPLGRVAVVVDGARDCAVVVPAEEGAATAVALAKAFIELRGGREFELRRMRSLVHAFGSDALHQTAGVAGSPYDSVCRGAAMRDVFGVHAAGTLWFAGVGAPFGRWRAEDLAWLSARATAEGVDELRLTPWRALLAPTHSRAAAEAIVLSCAERGLIVDGDEPSLFVAACPGAPDCPQARGDTRSAAQRLSAAARALYRDDGRPGLHLSGCSKGCAMPYATRATVVANGEAFDVILNGGASDAPARRLASLDEVEDLLKTLAYKPGERQARSREAEWPAQ